MHHCVRKFPCSGDFTEMTNIVLGLVETELYRAMISVVSCFLTAFIVIISVFKVPFIFFLVDFFFSLIFLRQSVIIYT